MEDAFSGKVFRGTLLAGALVVWGWSVYTSESVDLPYKIGPGVIAVYHDNIIEGFPAILVGLGLILLGVAAHCSGFWGQIEKTARMGRRVGTVVVWPGWICLLLGLGISAVQWSKANLH